jgi:hypothetical protein
MNVTLHVFLGLILVGFVAGCPDEPSPALSATITRGQQADAAITTHVAFPPGTQFLFYHRSPGMGDNALYVKVAIPTSALPAFLDHPTLTAAEWASEDSFVRDVSAWPQWKPSTVTKFRTAQVQLPRAEVLNILIDDGSGDPTEVYLMWHQT